MGIYDRDYYGDRSYGGGRVSMVQTKPMVTILIVINVAVFIIDFALRHRLMLYGAVNYQAATHPWLWYQTLTYGFLHGSVSHIFLNMLGLFFLGPAVESRLGRMEFLRFFLIAIVLGGVFWMLRVAISAPELRNLAVEQTAVGLVGASGAVSAVVMLFIMMYPHVELLLFFVIPVKAWVVGILIIVLNVFQVGSSNTAFDVHLVGIVFAVAYFKLRWDFSWMSAGLFDTASQKWRRLRGPKLKIHHPVQGDTAENGLEPDEADRLLEKIHREGEASLTAKERTQLEEYSRRMRMRRGR